MSRVTFEISPDQLIHIANEMKKMANQEKQRNRSKKSYAKQDVRIRKVITEREDEIVLTWYPAKEYRTDKKTKKQREEKAEKDKKQHTLYKCKCGAFPSWRKEAGKDILICTNCFVSTAPNTQALALIEWTEKFSTQQSFPDSKF